MLTPRRVAAAVASTAVLVAPLTVLAATPAQAADREFRYAGAEVDFDVSRDDGRFEVDVDLDDARPGSRWKIVLRHEGKVFYNRVVRADRDGEIDIDRNRRNTAGADTFKLSIRKVGASKARHSTIRTR